MSRIDVRELECFIAVADHLSFSKAARELNLSQPPLTRQIQALEEKLKAKVFTRNTHSVSLTPVGTLFLEDARAILRHLDRAGESVRRAQQGETSRLRLAFIGALLDEKLIRLIQCFHEHNREVQIQVADLAPSHQLESLQSGDLDGGFIGAKPKSAIKGMGFQEWNKEPLVLALPESHPLTQVKKINWRHLKGLQWVMVSNEAAPAFRHQFSSINERQSLKAVIVQESDRVPAVLTMVAAGSGVTMVPQSVTHLVSGGVVFRRLPHPAPVLNYVFAYALRNTSPALQTFLTLLRKSKTVTARQE